MRDKKVNKQTGSMNEEHERARKCDIMLTEIHYTMLMEFCKLH